MNHAEILSFVEARWDDSITPTLQDYIRIPCKSPHFDADWAAHGYIDDAVKLAVGWCQAHALEGQQLEVVTIEGRTPLIYIEVPAFDGTRVVDASSDDPERATIVLYGHLDKQPEMHGWREHLGPWLPVIEDDKLYGRGGADDGYAIFASLTAIDALRHQGIAHQRCVVVVETCEESGSYDLPHYIDLLAPRIGAPDLVVCLDSGCGNYDQLWSTTSLRGLVSGTLTVSLLAEGVHSGDASGIVPSSFRVLRNLMSRLEDPESGAITPGVFQADIPEQRRLQASTAAQVLGDRVYSKFPFLDGVEPVESELSELVLNRTWRAALGTTGADGLPSISDAGNVLRPSTSVKLSLRIPPTLDASEAAGALKQLLEARPAYGAHVSFEVESAANGWNAPPLAPWLETATDDASNAFFGQRAVYMGEGGAIPFMGMLGEKFPDAQFLITGVLGPQSNAHGPNEFLHLPTGKRLTCCVSEVIRQHGNHR
jgi:acetylornithine deacetylase/succinyl-diaminopimelate desuccinylase-like protein